MAGLSFTLKHSLCSAETDRLADMSDKCPQPICRRFPCLGRRLFEDTHQRRDALRTDLQPSTGLVPHHLYSW